MVYGKVRLESHPVAFLEDDSLRAAHAALCAQEQHKYWEVRELLLQVPLSWQQEHQNGSVFNAPTLRRLAVLAGLDLASFARCFRSGRHAVEVHRVSKLARQMRVYATPSFIVGEALSDADPPASPKVFQSRSVRAFGKLHARRRFRRRFASVRLRGGPFAQAGRTCLTSTMSGTRTGACSRGRTC